MTMRKMLFLAVGAAAVICAPAASEAAGSGRWCAVMNIGWGAVVEECIYPTLEACRPYVIAGNRGYCTENLNWTGYDRQRPRKKRKRSR
jgi:hypothetical protein